MKIKDGEESRLIRVLVVDDDEGIRWMLKELLEIYEFEVDTASSGAEALDGIAETKPDPDCVLMDVVMPEQSGLEVFRLMKQSKPDIPVIFMTGYPRSSLVREARQEGAVDVLSKPMNMKQLVSLIRNVANCRAAA